MSILKKPYEISVWEDRWDSDQQKFVEVRLGVIGSDKMMAQCRAIEPNLVRNVNGTKKFSFKMYKQYIDTITGEKVSNPFSDWLISERKVKLYYEDKWFDFIIKDVVESSSNYLYTYQLEDALVQELSKNGFGVTLDAQLMNNMGTAGGLGAKVLEETDWTVQSEVFVQKVEEALVYISIPYSDAVKYKKIIDQTDLSAGITTEEVVFTQPIDTDATKFTVLAFYSSCTEQPYRFQFIKLDDYANVSIDENRVINVANCQYYYDVLAAGGTYTKTNEGFYLPTGWAVLVKGPNAIDNKYDTTVSNWYRGARYGFAQDAEYVPLLDRYCQKFWTKGNNGEEGDNIFNAENTQHWKNDDSTGDYPLGLSYQDGIFTMQKAEEVDKWDGLFLECGNIGFAKNTEYILSYYIKSTTEGLKNIGGHISNVSTRFFAIYENTGTDSEPIWALLKTGNNYSEPIVFNFQKDKEYRVIVRIVTDNSEEYQLYIQPNRGIDNAVTINIWNIEVKKGDGAYYAFVDNTYTSPALVQNVISSPNGEKTSGWTAATTITTNGDKTKPEIESVYGRFEGSNFISIIDDLQGAGTTNKTYTSYLKVKFTDANQRLINSGFYDNRTLIGSVTTGEKWVLKPELVGTPTLNYSLNEVEYNTTTGCHDIDTNSPWTNLVSLSGSAESTMIFFRGTNVSEKEFKKKKIKLVISPPENAPNQEFYIKNLELYKAVPKTEGGTDYISPGELDETGIVTTTYNFFSPAALETVETAEELAYEKVDKSELYTKYTPIFNENAEKVRSVTAKESNYFNILQSIAETFECWLSLEVGRSADGAITSKVAKFKNYAGNDNYAAFRYGVNLKDIQRTYTSKNIVTKLMVKANSNEHAQGGFCTVQRAGANPTGESYLYDFQYYHNKDLLRAEDFIHVYYMEDAVGLDLECINGYELWYSTSVTKPSTPQGESPEGWSKNKVDAKWYSVKHQDTWTTPLGLGQTNLNGYYPRLKALNNLLLPINQSIIDLNTDLTTLRAEEAVEEGLYYAAKEGIEEVREDFKTLTGVEIDETSASDYTVTCEPKPESLSGDNWKEGASIAVTQGETSDIQNFKITLADGKKAPEDGGILYFQPEFTLFKSGVEIKKISPKIKVVFEAQATTATVSHTLVIVSEGSKARELQNQFAQYTVQLQNSLTKLGKAPDDTSTTSPTADKIKSAITEKEAALITKEAERDKYLAHKKALNKLFFEKYARFIQEGTWISEEYVDDDKYYIDAQSVLYNSCYPQVAYTINVLALSALPGYELFEFGLGDKTHAEDPEFFELEGGRVEVIISEKSENLDDPTKDVIRVQNFKNQFQDLFQKITATVQQTQYSTGAYQKAVALAEADVARKGEFLSDALSDANAKLSAAGQTSVKQDIDGITLTDSKTNDKMRLIGGAILMGVLDENGERKWKTGLTPEGISASLVTAGTINTGSIAIMDGSNPAFRWDAFGISAFNADWNDNGIQGTPDKTKFVRFDKHGLYGIGPGDGVVYDGTTWKPNDLNDVINNATFALTWEGLKVTGRDSTIAKMGKQGDYIFYVTDPSGKGVFGITNEGKVIATQIKTVGKDGDLPESPTQATMSELISSSEMQAAIDGVQDQIDSLEEQLGKFDITANSIAIYNDSLDDTAGFISWDDVIFLAGKKIVDGQIKDEENAKQAYLAGWNVTPNALWYDGTTTPGSFDNIGKQNTFGIYPKGLDDLPVEIEYSWDYSISDFYHDMLVELNDEKYIYSEYDNTIFDTPYTANAGRWYYREKAGTMTWQHEIATNQEIVPVDASKYEIITREQAQAIIGQGNSLVVIYKNEVTATSLPYFKGVLDTDDNWVLTAGDSFGVTKKGNMFASAGSIGGWEIAEDGIVKRDENQLEKVGIYSGQKASQSIPLPGQTSPIRFFAGADVVDSTEEFNITTNPTTVRIEPENCKQIISCSARQINAGGNADEAKIFNDADQPYAEVVISGSGLWGIDYTYQKKGNFLLLEDGSLYATAIRLGANKLGTDSSVSISTFDMSGTVGDASNGLNVERNDWRLVVGNSFGVTSKGSLYSIAGNIGGFEISDGELRGDNILLSSKNITCANDGKIIFQGLVIANSKQESNLTTLSVDNDQRLQLKTEGGSIIELNNSGEGQITVDYTVTLEMKCTYYTDSSTAGLAGTYKIELTGTENLTTEHEITFTARFDYDRPGAPDENITITQRINKNSGTELTGTWYSDTVYMGYFGKGKITLELGGKTKVSGPTSLGSSVTLTTSLQDRLVEPSTTRQILITGSLIPQPDADNLYGSLGSSQHKWSSSHIASSKADIAIVDEIYESNSTSDARRKNSISSLSDNYDYLFDLLNPCRYKYNEGTSNRYHTGFIAQEIVKALEDSYLTTQDFAGVKLYHPGEEDECWYLRRDEFVALNTWQIQKLKPRVSSLEQTILDYETRISSLEQQIQSLTSS